MVQDPSREKWPTRYAGPLAMHLRYTIASKLYYPLNPRIAVQNSASGLK